MNNQSRILTTIFLVWQLFNPGAIFADTLLLKNGQKIEGKIIKKTESFVRIEENGVPVTYFPEEISQIIEAPLIPAAEKPALESAPASADIFVMGDTAAVKNPDDAQLINPNDLNREKISEVIKNFVVHRTDADLTQYFTSVTEEFKKLMLKSDPVNRNAPQENDVPETIENFMLDDLAVNKDKTLTAGVSFFLSASYKTVTLKKDGSDWKIDNIQRAMGDSWVKTPNISAIPDYAAISEAIGNFFQHQNDKDLTLAFAGVTDEFKKVRLAHIKKRRLKDVDPPVIGIKHFTVHSLELNGNTGTANVSFISGPVTLKLIMKKEGEDWKVHGLVPQSDTRTGNQPQSK